jgi:hypothetical protein
VVRAGQAGAPHGTRRRSQEHAPNDVPRVRPRDGRTEGHNPLYYDIWPNPSLRLRRQSSRLHPADDAARSLAPVRGATASPMT